MAVRIGTPSPNLKPCGILSARKHVAGASGNASKVKLSTQLVSSAQSKMQLGLRMRLLAGKRVLIASDAKPSQR
jgi:esterase/lipase superfamily enzyme